MRILIATAHRSLKGGVESYLRSVLPLLRERGHDLCLVCATTASAGRTTLDEGFDWLTVKTASKPETVAAEAEKWRPDVVFSHELPDAATDAALVDRFPAVYFAHNYAGTCQSGSKCHAFPRRQPCARRLGPACLGLYFLRRCGGLNPVTAVTLYRTNRRRQNLFGEYRSVLAASNHMVVELVRNGSPRKRTHLVPLFPPDTTPDPSPPTQKPRMNRLLFVGRVTALKGWREFLAALPVASAILGRSLTLVVAGDGPDRLAFEAEARRRKIPAEFLGWVNPERRNAEMRSADILVVPSVWPEPFGLVGIEAGCVGLPAVGFAVGGIPDWLIPGVSGELASGERPDPTDLAAAIVRALEDDSHLQKLRIGAWQNAHQFTSNTHMNRLIPILEAAAQQPPPGL